MSNLIELRMPGSRRVSVAQLEELVAWMESHPLQARATQCNSPQAKQLSHRLWDELTSRLNAVGEGVTKTVREWRQYWSDQRYKVKKKGSAMRQHASGTGGGPSWDGILTPIEDRILSIMGVQNVMGKENIRVDVDMGFDDSPPPPVPLLELPLSWPITPDPPETPSTSSHPTPVVAERDAYTDHTPSPHTQPSPRTSSQARPPKRKHVAEAADADDDRPHSTAALSRRVLQWKSRRIREEEMRRALEERRLALEEQRLEEDRAWRREQQEEDQAWRREQLEEDRARRRDQLEEDRAWRRDLLSAIQRLTDALGQHPRPPSPFA